MCMNGICDRSHSDHTSTHLCIPVWSREEVNLADVARMRLTCGIYVYVRIVVREPRGSQRNTRSILIITLPKSDVEICADCQRFTLGSCSSNKMAAPSPSRICVYHVAETCLGISVLHLFVSVLPVTTEPAAWFGFVSPVCRGQALWEWTI